MKPRKPTRRTNPVSGRAARPPRMTFSFDGTFLNATKFIGTSATAANIGTDFQQIGASATFGICRDMNAMVQQYREYRFRKVTFQWIPSVGPATADAGSRIHLAYSENPEQCQAFQANVAPLDTVAKRLPFVKGCRNVFTFNAWERITWNVPLTRRRPWFDVNTTDPANDVNAFDRAVQGMIFQAYESVSAIVTLGTAKITFEMELRGLSTDVGAVV